MCAASHLELQKRKPHKFSPRAVSVALRLTAAWYAPLTALSALAMLIGNHKVKIRCKQNVKR